MKNLCGTCKSNFWVQKVFFRRGLKILTRFSRKIISKQTQFYQQRRLDRLWRKMEKTAIQTRIVTITYHIVPYSTKMCTQRLANPNLLEFPPFRLESKRIGTARSLDALGARVWTPKLNFCYFLLLICYISAMSGGEFNVSVCLFFESFMHQP